MAYKDKEFDSYTYEINHKGSIEALEKNFHKLTFIELMDEKGNDLMEIDCVIFFKGAFMWNENKAYRVEKHLQVV